MFGFGSKADSQYAYNELLRFLTEEWEMKERYARAFLDTYRSSIAKIHKESILRYASLANSSNPEEYLTSVANEGMQHTMPLVSQAYQAYMTELRRGKHVGTDVELAIWGILANRSDIIDHFDPAFGKWIFEQYNVKFPNLFDDVFNLGS